MTVINAKMGANDPVHLTLRPGQKVEVRCPEESEVDRPINQSTWVVQTAVTNVGEDRGPHSAAVERLIRERFLPKVLTGETPRSHIFSITVPRDAKDGTQIGIRLGVTGSGALHTKVADLYLSIKVEGPTAAA